MKSSSGLAIIGLAAMLALAGCTESDPAPAPTASQSAPTTGSIESPLPLGKAIRGSGWKVTVNAVNLDASAAVAAVNQFNPAPGEGEKYVLVNVTLERTGDSAAYPFDVQVGFVNANGITLREAAAQVPERIDLLAEMQPDAALTGNIGFIVDADTAAKGTLSVTPGGRDDRAYVAIR